MKTILVIFLATGLVAGDLLDLSYLPPPGAKLAGGNLGDTDVPLDLPKGSRLPNRPQTQGFEDAERSGDFGRGTEIPTGIPDLDGFTSGPSDPSNYYQNGFPTTTTSYAFTQTTTLAPFDGFSGTQPPSAPSYGIDRNGAFTPSYDQNQRNPPNNGLNQNYDQNQNQFVVRPNLPGPAPAVNIPGVENQYQGQQRPGFNDQSFPSSTQSPQDIAYTSPGTKNQYQGLQRPGFNTQGFPSSTQSPQDIAYTSPGTKNQYQGPQRPGFNTQGFQSSSQSPQGNAYTGRPEVNIPSRFPTQGGSRPSSNIQPQDFDRVSDNIGVDRYEQNVNNQYQRPNQPNQQRFSTTTRPQTVNAGNYGQTREPQIPEIDDNENERNYEQNRYRGSSPKQFPGSSFNNAPGIDEDYITPSNRPQNLPSSPRPYQTGIDIGSTPRPESEYNRNLQQNVGLPGGKYQQTPTSFNRPGQLEGNQNYPKPQIGAIDGNSQYNNDPGVTKIQSDPNVNAVNKNQGQSYASSTSSYTNTQDANRPSSRFERPQAESDRNADILNYENVLSPDGYSYSYDTSNGIHADETGITIDGTKAQGSYSYIGDDGKLYSVTYTADENGFQPRGDHLPTSPPIPEAILRALEKNARDKEAGIIDDGSYDEAKYGHKKYQGSKHRNRPKGKPSNIFDENISETDLEGARRNNVKLQIDAENPTEYDKNVDQYDEYLNENDDVEDTERTSISKKPNRVNESKQNKIKQTDNLRTEEEDQESENLPKNKKQMINFASRSDKIAKNKLRNKGVSGSNGTEKLSSKSPGDSFDIDSDSEDDSAHLEENGDSGSDFSGPKPKDSSVINKNKFNIPTSSSNYNELRKKNRNRPGVSKMPEYGENQSSSDEKLEQSTSGVRNRPNNGSRRPAVKNSQITQKLPSNDKEDSGKTDNNLFYRPSDFKTRTDTPRKSNKIKTKSNEKLKPSYNQDEVEIEDQITDDNENSDNIPMIQTRPKKPTKTSLGSKIGSTPGNINNKDSEEDFDDDERSASPKTTLRKQRPQLASFEDNFDENADRDFTSQNRQQSGEIIPFSSKFGKNQNDGYQYLPPQNKFTSGERIQPSSRPMIKRPFFTENNEEPDYGNEENVGKPSQGLRDGQGAFRPKPVNNEPLDYTSAPDINQNNYSNFNRQEDALGPRPVTNRPYNYQQGNKISQRPGGRIDEEADPNYDADDTYSTSFSGPKRPDLNRPGPNIPAQPEIPVDELGRPIYNDNDFPRSGGKTQDSYKPGYTKSNRTAVNQPGTIGTLDSIKPGRIPSTTYRPNYSIEDRTQNRPVGTVDAFGRPIKEEQGNLPGQNVSPNYRPISGGNRRPSQSSIDQGSTAYPYSDKPFSSSSKRPGNQMYGSTTPPDFEDQRAVTPGSRFDGGNGSSPGFNAGQPTRIKGEDFSGPKQPQRFDPETGYHY